MALALTRGSDHPDPNANPNPRQDQLEALHHGRRGGGQRDDAAQGLGLANPNPNPDPKPDPNQVSETTRRKGRLDLSQLMIMCFNFIWFCSGQGAPSHAARTREGSHARARARVLPAPHRGLNPVRPSLRTSAA